MNSHRLLENFLRYTAVDTTAVESAETYPSSPGQLELGRLLVDELKAMGLADARQDEYGIVTATIPAHPSAAGVPAIAFSAHLDTSPETSGRDVRPQVIRDYGGGDIVLGRSGAVIRAAENPALEKLLGRTLITTDGTTLLGADDKAGLAIIMETAAWLLENPQIVHGPLRICFTCDEEIGRGTNHIDIKSLDAAACYTLDGEGADRIDVETFSADLAVVAIRGVNIHPSIAKGRMTNALRAAADFLARLPQEQSPETTDGRQGFLHPYEIAGGVGEVRVRTLIRDFDTAKLAEHADTLRRAAEETKKLFPQAEIDVKITCQYRNMADALRADPRPVDYAHRALERLGRKAESTIVRGGTDGSRLTEMGLPTPNLSNGSHNPHSNLEWACLEEMLSSAEWLVSLAEVWAET